MKGFTFKHPSFPQCDSSSCTPCGKARLCGPDHQPHGLLSTVPMCVPPLRSRCQSCASHCVCNPHSWPLGRRAVWFPCVQWHFSPDLARLSLRGTLYRVCHFGRAKGRSVLENDCVLGDREQTVGCEKAGREET